MEVKFLGNVTIEVQHQYYNDPTETYVKTDGVSCIHVTIKHTDNFWLHTPHGVVELISRRENNKWKGVITLDDQEIWREE